MRAAFFLWAAGLSAQSADLTAKSRHAKELMGAGQFAEAVPIYEDLCRAIPGNAGLRLNLGLALQMAGRHQDAIPQFERVLKAEPNSVPALLSLGVSRLETNDSADAVPPLQKVVSLQPANPNARGLLAQALLSLSKPKEAALHYRKLSALAPKDPKPLFGAGQAYELLSKQAFEALNKTGEGSAEWLALVGESRSGQRQYRSAFYFYQQALQKQPNLRGAHAGLAAVYRATEHPDWAAAEEKREAALPPPNCVRDKAECDFAAGRFLDAAAARSPYWRARAYNQLALQAFSQLGKLPESVELYALKAQMLENHGQYFAAVAEWRAGLKLAPGDPRLEQELAKALYLARDYPHALPAVQDLLKRDPDAPHLQFFAGDSLLQMGQAEEAIPYLLGALKADPELMPAHATLGIAYARVGRSAEAIPHLQAALQTDDDGSLHYQLARAYQDGGDASNAKKLMDQYQGIKSRSEAEERKLEKDAQITAPPP